jgi:hypothetical protein
MTIGGAGLKGSTSVKFVNATDPTKSSAATFTVQSDNVISLTVPKAPGSPMANIVIQTPAGLISTSGYSYPPVTATMISPSSGAHGAAHAGVQITGSGFSTGTTTVYVKVPTWTAAVTANTGTVLTVTTPSELAGGPYDVVVTTPAGSVTLSAAYSYT